MLQFTEANTQNTRQGQHFQERIQTSQIIYHFLHFALSIINNV